MCFKYQPKDFQMYSEKQWGATVAFSEYVQEVADAVKVVPSEETAAMLCKVNWTGKNLHLRDQMCLREFHFEKLYQSNIFKDL